MIRANRGVAPTCLSDVKDGMTELDRAREHFTTGGQIDGFLFDVYRRPAVRTSLQKMFHGKCAYCEHFYAGSFTEDIEHFRPKARIDTNSGQLHPGYWWLGSNWENLLPSCARCNKVKWLQIFDGTRLKVGKGNRFPLADETLRATAEGTHVHETPLLIDPTVEDPAEFIAFDIIDGRCIAVPRFKDENSLGYRKARTSIDIYGLNRRQLVKDRTRIYVGVRAAIENLKQFALTLQYLPGDLRAGVEARMQEERDRINALLKSDQPHAGMSRFFARPFLEALGVVP